MPLTKQLISEIAADMAAEQAYYKRLHTLIECAKHTGAPIPQVRPFPGRLSLAGTVAGYEATTPARAEFSPGRSGSSAALHSREAGQGTPPRRGGVRWHLRSFGQAIGRLLSIL